MHFRGSIAASGLILLLAGLPASAGLIQEYSATGASGVDAAYENVGGFLQNHYGLSSITKPNGTTQSTVLPQLERAVAQLARNNANGLTVPTSASGTPGVSYIITGGGTGTGVWDALTNHGPVGNGGVNGGGSVANQTGGGLPSFGSAATSVDFSYSRTGNVVTYATSAHGSSPTLGTTWTSSSQTYFSDLNAVEFRIRSTGTGPTSNTESYTNLLYNGTSLADITAAGGDVTIELFSGISGDFTLTGTFNTSGGSATGWNAQIKGLDLPDAVSSVPEPSTLLSAVVGGIGCLIAAARRRKSASV